MNAVMVQGDAVGTTLYYGKGAGAEPTASAVIADLVDIARLATADPDHRVPHLAFQPAAMQDLAVLPIDEVVTAVLPAPAGRRRDRRAGAHHRNPRRAWHLDRRAAAAAERGRRVEARTDVIILTHDTVEGQDDERDRADAGAADGARPDRPDPQGRPGVMWWGRPDEVHQHARRRDGAASRRSCSRASRPTAASTCRSAIQPRRANARGLAQLVVRRSRVRAPPLYIDDIAAADLRALVARTYRGESSATRASRRSSTRARCLRLGLSNGPTLAFKDMAMQLLGHLFEYELGRRGGTPERARRDLGRHRQRRRVRAEGQARHQVFMLSPRGRMTRSSRPRCSACRTEHPQPRRRRPVRRLPGPRQGGLGRPRLQAPARDRHGQLDQLGAPPCAGRLLRRRLLPGDEGAGLEGRDRSRKSASPFRRATSATSAPATSPG